MSAVCLQERGCTQVLGDVAAVERLVKGLEVSEAGVQARPVTKLRAAQRVSTGPSFLSDAQLSRHVPHVVHKPCLQGPPLQQAH